MPRRSAWTPIAAIVVGALAVVGCAGGDVEVPTPHPDDPVVVSFLVADEEPFRVLLIEREDIAGAWALGRGEDVPSIPNGLVIRDEPSVNEGYSWSLDPSDFEWADVTTEVCDGLPSDVEAGTITSDRYCPWSAVVMSVETSTPTP
jgi:hypothetical protein